MPTSDLELRIDPERTIDLFSMNPKVRHLHVAMVAMSADWCRNASSR
jgi:hypothetical protein